MAILAENQVDQFVQQGFIKLSNVVHPQLCAQIRDILWRDTGVNPDDPASWTKPVIRLGDYSDAPFREAANAPGLILAFDQLVGKNNWLPRGSLGTFPIRFPSDADPGDTGWHVDASFAGADPNDYLSWRINVHSKGRALLMLFLFSDVGPADAPTKIQCGSHKHVARILSPFGEEGLSFMELASRLPEIPALPEAYATGTAGTVYLCHPFISHAAQPHRGAAPKFMAQPPLGLKQPFTLQNSSRNILPVERAIIDALRI